MPAQATRELRLLVVEDSDDDYKLLLHFLQREGYEPKASRVDNAQGLARALADRSWDLVISDHQLPGFGSREALELVRATPAPPPFIIVSGTIGESAAVDAMLSGADDYVVKGNLVRLPPAIDRSLAVARARREHAASESARREADARLSGIARNLPGVLLQIGFDQDTGSIALPYISEGTQQLFGHSAPDLMAAPQRLIGALHPDDRSEFLLHVAAAARAHAPISWEGRISPSREAPARWILIAASPRSTQDGRQLWDGLVMDLTAQKNAENEVRQSRQRLRELASHLEEVKEAERAEVAREVHDDLGGLLTGVKVDLDWMRRHMHGVEGMQAKVEDMAALTDEMVLVVRRVARALRPAILDQGLVAALEWLTRDFADRTSINCTFTTNSEDVDLPAAHATSLFRAVQESLTNVSRHAQAQNVEVELFRRPSEITIEIRDDGRGIAPGDLARAGSFGLRGMEERVRHLGGGVDISGGQGRGTTVMLFMPVPLEETRSS